MTLLRSLFAFLVLLVLAGCSTIQSRIKDHAAEFAALDQNTQEKIKAGILELGYTEHMAFMVLGGPDEKTEQTTKDGKETIWIYLHVRNEYLGSALTHVRRIPVRDPKTGLVTFIYRPEYEEVYQPVEEEHLRVFFHDGKVTAFEQEKKG